MILFLEHFLTVAMSLAAAIYASNCIYKSHKDIAILSMGLEYRRRLMLGAALTFAGLFFHQGWWFMYELAKVKGDFELQAMFEANALPPMTVSYLLINAGIIVVMSSWFELTFGRYWYAFAGLLIASTLILSFIPLR